MDNQKQEYSIDVYCSLSFKKDLFSSDVHEKHMDIMDAAIERVRKKEKEREEQYSEVIIMNESIPKEELTTTTILPKKITAAKIFFLASRKVSSGRTS